MSQTIEKTNDEKYGAMVEALNNFYWDNSISPNETAARLDKFAAEVWRLAEYIRDNDPALDTPRSRTPHETDTGHTCPLCKGEKVLSYDNGKVVDVCYHCNGRGQV